MVGLAGLGFLAAAGARAPGVRRRERERGKPAPRRRGAEGQAEAEATEEGMPALRPGFSDRQRFFAGRWWLGVYAYNTNTGVVITRVLPGSPAARAGLERHDVIVTVDGYQVGFVGGLLYPLGDELQLRADRAGRVTFLVQNCRNDQLLVLPVRLERFGPIRAQPLESEPS